METIDYQDLKGRCESANRKPTYQELLSTKEWFNKRNEIINRDKRCVICESVETDSIRDNKGQFHNVQFKEVYGPLLLEKVEGIFINIAPENYILTFSKKNYWFHIHHKYYILSKLPWEYENEALITMCNWCHHQWHLDNKAPVYDLIDYKLSKCNFTVCDRCNGAGILPEYKHVQNGICFNCCGYKYIEIIGLHEI